MIRAGIGEPKSAEATAQPGTRMETGQVSQCCCGLLLAAALGAVVQWMIFAMPPTLDSAGKVTEQVLVWGFPQCSGESSEQLHSWEADLVFQLNGRGASLTSLLVNNYLPTAFIPAQCYCCAGSPCQRLSFPRWVLSRNYFSSYSLFSSFHSSSSSR